MTNDPTVGTIDFGGYGCSGTDLGDTWVYVSGPHVSTPTALPAVPESGQPVTFNSTVLYAGQTPDTFWWSWSPARDLQCAPSTNLSLACTPLRTGNYSITAHIQDSTGSNGSATLQPFYVARGPMVSRPLANTTHVDVGQSVQFTTTLVFNASGGDVYSWSASGAGMGCPASSLLTLVCVPTAAGTYNVTARVTDLVGGSGWNVSRDITVAPIPAAGIPIAVPAPSVDVGQMVEFSANVSNGGAGGDQYLWSASPTSGLLCPASQSPHVTCLATAAGWYNVTLTVIDSNGGRGWGEVEYRVFALPSLHAPTPSPGSLDVGQSAVFSPGIGTPGSGGLKFDWNSSGTGLGCGSNTLVTYTCTPTTAGSYTVSVIANDSNGGEGRAVSAPFQVFALPAVSSPERSVASPAVQESVTFTSELLSGGSGGDLFTWSSSISSLVCATSKALADTCTASAPGSYRVTLTVTDSNGGTGSATTTTFTVTGPLQATASAVPSSGKASLTVTFSSSVWGGTAPYSYAWRFGDGPAGTSADANPTHVYTSKGNYQVELWVNDSSGNSVAVTVAVSVSAPESPTFFSSVPGGGLTVGLFLLLAVVVTLALIVLLRRRREPEPASGPFSSYSPGPTSGGSPGGDSPPPPA
jgi:PKD repeat protein